MLRNIWKRIRTNKILLTILVIFISFVIYMITFKITVKNVAQDESMSVINVEEGQEKTSLQLMLEQKKKEEEKKTLLARIGERKKMYISDEEVENIKISGDTLDKFKRAMDVFVDVRKIDGDFSPKNYGRTDTGIEFETDFNYFKLTDGKKTEYYKIPIISQKEFQDMYRRMIYTSLDFITDNKDIGKMRVYHGNDDKRIWPWRKDDVIHKILYKREVGKIQPEKEFKKYKENYTIRMEKNNTKIKVQTMGKDFIKVECGDNIAYYEVYPDLYNYLHKEVFN